MQIHLDFIHPQSVDPHFTALLAERRRRLVRRVAQTTGGAVSHELAAWLLRSYPVLAIYAPVMTTQEGKIEYPGDPMCLYSALSLAVEQAIKARQAAFSEDDPYNDLCPRWGSLPSRDYRQATDWLAQKRFALYLFSQSDDTLNAKSQGLSVHVLDTGNWKEAPGLDAIGGAYLLMDKPAHPNAVKILLNWLLSRDGQIALQRDGENAGSIDSLRIDIPKTDVNPIMRRKDGVKYLEMWNPGWMNMKPVEELIDKVMGEGKKN